MGAIDDLWQSLLREMDNRIKRAMRDYKPNLSSGVTGTLPTSAGGTGNGRGEAKPKGPAGGDLGGTYPDPSVEKIRGFPVSDEEPEADEVLAWNGSQYVPTLIEAGGGSGEPIGPAGGDLGGTYPNPVVEALQGRTVVDDAPTSGDVLGWNGTVWGPQPAGTPTLPEGSAGMFLMHDGDQYRAHRPVVGPRGWLYNKQGYMITTTAQEV